MARDMARDMAQEAFVESPCIRVCRLDPVGICIGCLRSVAEIAAWGEADAAGRHAILTACARRQESLAARRRRGPEGDR